MLADLPLPFSPVLPKLALFRPRDCDVKGHEFQRVFIFFPFLKWLTIWMCVSGH